ncbi:MAG: ribonuclease Z [Candidatus Binatia bacterium]
MKAAFLARLVNGPFGDPGLHIDLRWEGRALLFDLGHNDALPVADILRVTHVFVSHCHIDHFIGFDRLLRVFLARDRKLYLFGPPGIIDCVAGKLSGYTWNLVDNYGFAIEVAEIGTEKTRRAVFPAVTGFTAQELPALPFTGVVLDDLAFRIRVAHLDHRIYSLGFALEEKTHLNVDTTVLAQMQLRPGPWLSEVKNAIRRGEDDEFRIVARCRERHLSESARELRLGELRNSLVRETRGQKIAYVVDTIFTPENAARIAGLAEGADFFFCESPFLNQDEDQATRRYHLTARQAGLLGRMANVRKLIVFHFSPRYAGKGELLYQEALTTFRGEDLSLVATAEPEIPGDLENVG